MSNSDVGFRGEGRTCKSKSYPGFSIEYMNYEEAGAEKHWTKRKRKSSSEDKINLDTIMLESRHSQLAISFFCHFRPVEAVNPT